MFLQIIRWHILFSTSVGLLLKANLYGKFYTLVLPGQLFGEAAKAIVISKNTNNYEKGISSVIIDKITGLIGLFIVGIFGFIFTNVQLPKFFFISMMICMFIVLITLFMLRINFAYNIFLIIIDKIKITVPYFSSLLEKIKNISISWREYSNNIKTILISIFYGIIFEMLSVFASYIICIFLGINVNFIDLCWVDATLSTMLLLPISFGGIGIREGTLIGLFYYINVTPEQAVSVSIMHSIFMMLMAIAGGIVVYYDIFIKKSRQKIIEGD